MRAIGRWLHLMSSTVLVAARTTMNAYGEASYGTNVSYPAHISRKRRIVRNAMGQEVVSGQAVYLGASPVVDPTARVTLSTAEVGSTESALVFPPIVAVERRSDQYGPHHTVIFLG